MDWTVLLRKSELLAEQEFPLDQDGFVACLDWIDQQYETNPTNKTTFYFDFLGRGISDNPRSFLILRQIKEILIQITNCQ